MVKVTSYLVQLVSMFDGGLSFLPGGFVAGLIAAAIAVVVADPSVLVIPMFRPHRVSPVVKVTLYLVQLEKEY